MKHFIFLLLCLSFSCSSSFGMNPIGNDGPEGGDEIGMEFRLLTSMAMEEVRTTLPQLLSATDISNYEFVSDILGTLVVRNPSVSIKRDLDSYTIILDKKNWLQTSDVSLRKVIAFHEILCLIRLESDGNYSLSSIYADSLSVPLQNLEHFYAH